MSAAEPAPPRERRPRARTTTPKGRNADNRILLVAEVDATGRGVLVPADGFSRRKLKSKHAKRGTKFIAYLYAVRDEKQWAKAHRLGQLLCDHVESFMGLDAHGALKRLQVEARVECEVETIEIKGYGFLERVVPNSLAFGEMDQVVFDRVYPQLCEQAKKYFHLMPGEVVDDMVKLMEDPA